MKLKKSPLSLIIVLLLVGLLSSCQSTKQAGTMVGDMKAKNSDEAEVYATISKVQEYISSSQWDKWLALYSDDAVLTERDRKVSKEEMRDVVDGISYKITEMEILQNVVGKDAAFVSVRMVGNGKEQLESYKLAKFDGQWLITEEMNP